MKIPFDLQKYLTDPTLKVVTRDGDADARIICTNANESEPVIAIVEGLSKQYSAKGKLMGTPPGQNSMFDLFIQDGTPEPELTQFEHTLGVFIYGDAYDDPKIEFSASQKGFLRLVSRDVLLPLAKNDLKNLKKPSK